MNTEANSTTKRGERIAVVTGANTGLGYETSLGLAREGYTVVLACRSEAKANDAIDRIRRQLPNARLDFLRLDLVDRRVVRSFAESFSERYGHLDVLVNNAGVMGPPHTITENGLELQFDANHMGHFYLTALLMERLDQEFETRIVNVSSLAGKRETADIHFDNLNFEGTYDEGPRILGLGGMEAYQQSKLANILFTLELQERLERTEKRIQALVVHPGISTTDLARNAPALLRAVFPIVARFMNISRPADGAKPTLMAALDAGVRSGDFIGPTGTGEQTGAPGRVDLPPKASDRELRTKLWELSERELDLRFPI